MLAILSITVTKLPISVVIVAILAVSIPLTDCAYAARLCPNDINCVPNVLIELSPVNNDSNPPLFGKLSANDERACAALAEFATTPASSPETLAAYDFKLVPNDTNCAPKVLISFSPANIPVRPPLLGSPLANDDIADAAFAEFVTTPASKPETLVEYDFKLGPNAASSSPNFAKSFSPVTLAINPPSFGIAFANSAILVAAAAADCTVLASIPSMLAANSLNLGPNATN